MTEPWTTFGFWLHGSPCSFLSVVLHWTKLQLSCESSLLEAGEAGAGDGEQDRVRFDDNISFIEASSELDTEKLLRSLKVRNMAWLLCFTP